MFKRFISCFIVVLLVIPLFAVCVLGVASPLTTSRFKYNSVWGLTTDTAPYPDGVFLEIQSANGSFYVLNFTRQHKYGIAKIDINGSVVDSYFPAMWRVSGSSLEVQSGDPIMILRSSNGSWEHYGNNGSHDHSYVKYYDETSGNFLRAIQAESSIVWFYSSFSATDKTLVSNSPAFYYIGDELQHTDTVYTLANCYSSAVVSSGISSDILETLDNIYSDTQETLQVLYPLASDVYYALECLIEIRDNMITLFEEANTYLHDIKDSNDLIYADVHMYLDGIWRTELPSIIDWLSYTFDMEQANFLLIEDKLDDIQASLDKITNNNGVSGGQVIDDGVQSAKDKAEEETPDPANVIDETQFSIDSLIGAFNWIKTQLNNFFSITHIDTMLEVVLFIALAGWVIGKKLNKG